MSRGKINLKRKILVQECVEFRDELPERGNVLLGAGLADGHLAFHLCRANRHPLDVDIKSKT